MNFTLLAIFSSRDPIGNTLHSLIPRSIPIIHVPHISNSIIIITDRAI